MTNRLAQESSPYLLQHAENPVDWYPWDQTALELARQQDKPIFLSVGYAACHWCHVMAHESFEDPATAEVMNEHFINIKVDREERPDIDSIYMDAVVAMTGSGGWPMSVFLTPQGEPFFGGTYFPPERRHGLPSFKELLLRISQSWQQDRENIQQTGRRLSQHLEQQTSLPAGSNGSLDENTLQQAAERLHNQYDWKSGGWGQAPKFPQPAAIEFLLQRSVRHKDSLARDMAVHALSAMADGGIYDQLGGGFARYSVDGQWRIPHFEKMLYDNALLLGNYLTAWHLTDDDSMLRVAEDTLDFLHSDMQLESGGYASSLDADSEGQEGKYYSWEYGEVHQLLSAADSFELFKEAFGLRPEGNFEGANVLYRARTTQQLALDFDQDPQEIQQQLQQACETLLAARRERVAPALDDKVLTSWNSLLLNSLASGAKLTGLPHWREAAQQLAEFLVDAMFVDGRLKRSWRQGQARFDAYLEDHAALGLGLLNLYSMDFNPKWYRLAQQMADTLLDRFVDPDGGFFDTAVDHESLLTRPKTIQDSPTPSGNSLAVRLMLRMASLTGQDRYRIQAEKTLSAVGNIASRHPTAFATWLSELAFALGPQIQLAIIGDPKTEGFQSLSTKAHRWPSPDLVIAGGQPSAQSKPELLEGRELIGGRATAYLCQGFSCQLPTNDPQVLTEQLEAALG